MSISLWLKLEDVYRSVVSECILSSELTPNAKTLRSTQAGPVFRQRVKVPFILYLHARAMDIEAASGIIPGLKSMPKRVSYIDDAKGREHRYRTPLLACRGEKLCPTSDRGHYHQILTLTFLDWMP